MVRFEDRKIKEVEIKEVGDLLSAPLDVIQLIKGGLQVESNLPELVEEMELNTKVQIMEKEAEIPVDEFIYEKLKGKKIKVVIK
ncbi:MAG: hypothetical protein H8D26_06715 [Methanomicrobia archaeon]|nr:hypothetical protein [Methanomicrobia archaeon]